MALTKVIGAGLGSVSSADLDGAVTINESSADKDFRVESNGNANMLVVNGGTDRVGIGTDSPTEVFEVHSGSGNIAGKFVSTDSLALVAFKDNSTSDVVLAGASGDNLAVSHNILFTNASKGVYLGVTSATASNLLDDYEEGTWTPTLLGSSSNPSVSYTSNNFGGYTKIGDTVHAFGRINTTSVSGGSGTALIGGLPFTTHAGSTDIRNGGALGYISNVSLSTGYTQFGLSPDANANTIRLVQSGSGVGGNIISVGVVGNSFDCPFTLTYKV